MTAATLHNTLFGGATKVEVGRRIGCFRLFNVDGISARCAGSGDPGAGHQLTFGLPLPRER
jgi:hypothetical protein